MCACPTYFHKQNLIKLNLAPGSLIECVWWEFVWNWLLWKLMSTHEFVDAAFTDWEPIDAQVTDGESTLLRGFF